MASNGDKHSRVRVLAAFGFAVVSALVIEAFLFLFLSGIAGDASDAMSVFIRWSPVLLLGNCLLLFRFLSVGGAGGAATPQRRMGTKDEGGDEDDSNGN